MAARQPPAPQPSRSTRPAWIDDILRGRPAGLNALLAEHGHELAEYVRALVSEDDPRLAQVYEDVLVDILRQLRLASDRHNGRLRLFTFESAARTVRRRHAWIFQSHGGTGSRVRAPMRDIAKLKDPLPAELRRALAGLTAGERELLCLRFRFGFDYDQISEILKEARVAFEDRLMAARERFRARLLGVEPSDRYAAVH